MIYCLPVAVLPAWATPKLPTCLQASISIYNYKKDFLSFFVIPEITEDSVKMSAGLVVSI